VTIASPRDACAPATSTTRRPRPSPHKSPAIFGKKGAIALALATLVRMNLPRLLAALPFLVLSAPLAAACGGSDANVDASDASTASDVVGPRGGEQVGQSCTSAAQCYPSLADGSTVKGEIKCLDRVTGGYCTHLCTSDADCCATPGECKTGFKEVCAPFESTGLNMCFLSCETADLHALPEAGADATAADDNAYCAAYAGSEFSCRSTGGGKNNRKICAPSGSGTSDAGPG
jgi:hypothetical protein